jgi:hypothetical protein
MKTQRTTREQNYQQHRRNLLHEAGIPQIEVQVDREPTEQEEIELNKQIAQAMSQIRQAQLDGRLPEPLRDTPMGYHEAGIREYKKVLVNGLPVYS